MNELRQSITLLLVLGLAFAAMLGVIAPRRVPGILGRILLLPLLLGVLFAVLGQLFREASPLMQLVLLLGLGPIALVVLLRIVLGKSLFTHILGNLIYDLLKAAFLGAWRAGVALPRLMLRRSLHGRNRRARRGQRHLPWQDRRTKHRWDRR